MASRFSEPPVWSVPGALRERILAAWPTANEAERVFLRRMAGRSWWSQATEREQTALLLAESRVTRP